MWPPKILENLGSLHAKHWWVAHLEEHDAQRVHLMELERQSILVEAISGSLLQKTAARVLFIYPSTESKQDG